MNSYEKILATLEGEQFGKACEKTIAMLRENIREQEAAKKGNKKPVKIIEKMIKDAAKDSPWQKMFQAAHKYTGGYAFLDGHRIFFTDTPEGFDLAEDHNKFNVDDFLKSANNADYTPIKIDIAEVRYLIKVTKKSDRIPYIIRTADGFAGFNPYFLLDLLEFSGVDTILYTGRKAPIFSENRKALALPINLAWATDKDADIKYNEYRNKWYNDGFVVIPDALENIA